MSERTPIGKAIRDVLSQGSPPKSKEQLDSEAQDARNLTNSLLTAYVKKVEQVLSGMRRLFLEKKVEEADALGRSLGKSVEVFSSFYIGLPYSDTNSETVRTVFEELPAGQALIKICKDADVEIEIIYNGGIGKILVNTHQPFNIKVWQHYDVPPLGYR